MIAKSTSSLKAFLVFRLKPHISHNHIIIDNIVPQYVDMVQRLISATGSIFGIANIIVNAFTQFERLQDSYYTH